MSTISMPSGITRGRATSSCSPRIRTATARGLFVASTDWVGSCAIIIERWLDGAPAVSVFLLYGGCSPAPLRQSTASYSRPKERWQRVVDGSVNGSAPVSEADTKLQRLLAQCTNCPLHLL